MMLYSANNTPYSALMGVMTPDASERSSIASYRFVGALVGQFVIQALPLPLVAKLGGGDSARGWAMTMAIFGGADHRLEPDHLRHDARTRAAAAGREGTRCSDDLKDVFTCRPWLVMFVLTLLVFTMLVVRGSSSNYFFAYYLDQGQIKDFLAQVGLARHRCRRGDGLEGRPRRSRPAGQAGRLERRRRGPEPVLRARQHRPDRRHHRLQAARRPLREEGRLHHGRVRHHRRHRWPCSWSARPRSACCSGWASSGRWVGGPTVPLLWVMIADVADYSEWKTSRRATGFMYAGILFALKAGLSLGGALSAWVIDVYGYVPNVAQTEHALLGIRLGASIYPAHRARPRHRVPGRLPDRQEARTCASRMSSRRDVGGSSAPTRHRNERSRTGAVPGAAELATEFLVASAWPSQAGAGAAEPWLLKEVMPKGMTHRRRLEPAADRRRRQSLRPDIVTRHFNSAISPENVLKWGRSTRSRTATTSSRRTATSRSPRSRGWRSSATRSSGTADARPGCSRGRTAPVSTGRPALDRMREHIGRWSGATRAASRAGTSSTKRSRRRRARCARAVARGHRRRLHRQGLRVRARGGPGRRALLQRLQPRTSAAKRAAAIRIVKELKAEGLRVDGDRRAGALGHRRAPARRHRRDDHGHRSRTGIKVLITELDVDVLPRDPDMWGADL